MVKIGQEVVRKARMRKGPDSELKRARNMAAQQKTFTCVYYVNSTLSEQ